GRLRGGLPRALRGGLRARRRPGGRAAAGRAGSALSLRLLAVARLFQAFLQSRDQVDDRRRLRLPLLGEGDGFVPCLRVNDLLQVAAVIVLVLIGVERFGQ